MISKSFTITQASAGRVIPFYFDFKVNTEYSDIKLGVAEWYSSVYVSPDTISPVTNWHEIQSITVPSASDIDFDDPAAYELWIPDQSSGPALDTNTQAYSLDTSTGNPNPPVLQDVVFRVSDGSLEWNPLRVEISLIFRHS